MKNFFKKRGSQVSNHSNRSERTFFKQLIRSEELHEEIFQRLTVIYSFENLFTSFQTNKFWPFHDYGPFFELEYTNPSYYKAVVQFILWERLLPFLKTISSDIKSEPKIDPHRGNSRDQPRRQQGSFDLVRFTLFLLPSHTHVDHLQAVRHHQILGL